MPVYTGSEPLYPFEITTAEVGILIDAMTREVGRLRDRPKSKDPNERSKIATALLQRLIALELSD